MQMMKQMTLVGIGSAMGLAGAAGCGDDHPHHYRDRTVIHEEVRRPPPVDEEIIVVEGDGPRPPMRREVIPVRPHDRATWEGGRWVREGHRWVWVRGRWS